MSKLQVSNVRMNIQETGGRASLSCEANGLRYHVWIVDIPAKQIEKETGWVERVFTYHDYGTVYCNPPENLKFTDKGHFTTRKLKSNIGIGKQVFEAMLERYDDALEAAKIVYAEEEAKRKAEAAAGRLRNARIEHAEELHNRLEWALSFIMTYCPGSVTGPAAPELRACRETLVKIEAMARPVASAALSALACHAAVCTCKPEEQASCKNYAGT